MYQSIDITGRGNFGFITQKSPRSTNFTVNANEFSILTLAVTVTRGGALLPANPGILLVQTSPDGGMTWRNVNGTMEPITGEGTFLWQVDPNADRIFPLCRATCTAPIYDPEVYYVVDAIYQNKLSPTDPSFIKADFTGNITASTGFTLDGNPVVVSEDTLTPSNSTPLPSKIYYGDSPVSPSNPLPVATGGGQMVVEPYDTVERSDITTTETHYVYKLSGVVQATVKVTFDTSAHARILSVTRL